MTIDGRKISAEILENLKLRVAALPFKPVFCDVLVGDDPASAQYVSMKGRLAEKIGMKFRRADYPASITTGELVEEIKKINKEKETGLCGLIVQLPLPQGFDKTEVLNAIEPEIDVDCTGQENSDKFYKGEGFLQFPTAAAVMTILDSLGMKYEGKKFVVIGKGELVGRPVAALLQFRGLEVSVVTRKTENTPELLKNADVIISAAGTAKLVTGDKVKPGCVVVDAGTSELGGGIVGDVDFESVSKVAEYISPVPGGVGPVTVATLLSNVCCVAERRVNK